MYLDHTTLHVWERRSRQLFFQDPFLLDSWEALSAVLMYVMVGMEGHEVLSSVRTLLAGAERRGVKSANDVQKSG